MIHTDKSGAEPPKCRSPHHHRAECQCGLEVKCEGCGAIHAQCGYTLVRLLNGALYLCNFCLAQFNGKNPEVKQLRDDFKKLFCAVIVPLELLNAVYGHTDTFSNEMKQAIEAAVQECRRGAGILAKAQGAT